MRLYHYSDDPKGNFGDDLNPWLWPQLRPDLLDQDPNEIFLGIGTLLNTRTIARQPKDARLHVFSTGAGYGEAPVPDGRWTIHCVRGPRTARALGISPEMAVTDGAALVADVPPPASRPGAKVAFIPHHLSLPRAPWAAMCRVLGLRFISMHWPVERVLAEMRGCDLIAAEAMHGAIVADALRVPWAPVVMHEQVLLEKWKDWTESLAVGLDPILWTPPLAIRGGARRGVSGRLRAPGAMLRLGRELEGRDGTLSGETRLTKAREELLRRLALVGRS